MLMPLTFRKLLSVQIFFTSLLLSWVWFSGKNVGWDALNHHFYLPFSWITGRIDTDFYGAGPQSYQNPLGYFPFYYMVVSGWPDWIVGVVFSILHSLVFGVLWILSIRLWVDSDKKFLWSGIAVLMAFCTPVFLQTAGTSSVDPITAFCVVTAVMLLIIEPGKSKKSIFFSGFLFGLAFSIKQSNAIYILSALFILFIQLARNDISWKHFGLYAVGGILSSILGMSWWMWKLWQKFGNPFFPLYNNLFKSPFAPSSAPLLADRFIPENILEAFFRPWEMLLPKKYVYTEYFSQDIKIFVAFIFILIFIFIFNSKIKNKLSIKKEDFYFTLFFLVSYVLWLVTSANGRYGIPLLLFSGVLLVRYIYLCFSYFRALIFIAFFSIIQVFIFISADESVTTVPWGRGSYYDIRSSEELFHEPALHFALGMQTYSSIAAHFHQDGALVNLVGQISLPENGVSGKKISDLMEKWNGRWRVLIPGGKEFIENNEKKKQVTLFFSRLLYRFRLDVDWNDCKQVDLVGNPGIFSEDTDEKPVVWKSVLSCRAIPTNQVFPDFEKEKIEADKIFNFIENSCPSLYSPSGFSPSEWIDGIWQRNYPNNDVIVRVHLHGDVWLHHGRSVEDKKIGAADDLIQEKGDVFCGKISYKTPE